MTDEHPFAPFIRILGKGPNLSRPLTEAEALAAGRLLFAGAVEPIQVGAFLCLLRVKTETAPELAGLVRAAREGLRLPAALPRVDLDWPVYATKGRTPPWFLLAALLLARRGVRVLLHGDRTAGGGVALAAVRALGIGMAESVAAVDALLAARGIAFLPLDAAAPYLAELMRLRPLLGVRSPINTLVRALNPCGARQQIIGTAHPAYRAVHRDTALLLGQQRLAVFKGEGGEAERRPGKPCAVFQVVDGQTRETAFAPLAAGTQPHEGPVTAERLVRLWQGDGDDPHGAASAIATAAVALQLLDPGLTAADADRDAAALWHARARRGVAA